MLMVVRVSVCDEIAAARHRAEREGKSVGEVISALARLGLQGGALRKAMAVRNGVPLLPRRDNVAPVTLELVNRLPDEAP